MIESKATHPEEIWMVTPIWGEKYWQFFTRYCLPSLLTDHNIGALRGHKVRYVIITLKEDIPLVQKDPVMEELFRHANVGFIYISRQLIEQCNNKNYIVMSRCHNRALEEAKNVDAGFFFIFPDTIIANGGLRFSMDMCTAGYRAVMVSGFRAKKEELCPALEQYRLQDRVGTLPLRARDLARLALDRMHPISLAHMQKGNRVRMFARHYWPMEDWGILERTFHPGPFFYWPMVKGDLIHSTLDHDLVKLGIPDQSKIHLVNDSDNLFVCEASDTSYQASTIPHRTLSIDEFADWALNWTNDYHRDFIRERIVIRTQDGDIPPDVLAESDRVIVLYMSYLEKTNGSRLTDFTQGERRLSLTNMIDLFKDLQITQQYGAAWQLAGEIESLINTIDHRLILGQWLQFSQFRTLQANVAERLFLFQEAAQVLEDDYQLLKQIQDVFTNTRHSEIDFELISTVTRTYADSLAFYAPFKPEYFERAEALFLEEQAYPHNKDLLSQDLALFNLYLDWGKQDKAEKRLETIFSKTDLNQFLENPDRCTVNCDPYALAAWLKYQVYRKEKLPALIWQRLNLVNLFRWYGDEINEHPFQLICAYLGRLSLPYAAPDDRPQDFFYHAMSLPKSPNISKACHHHAIKAQILTWWAMVDHEMGRAEEAAFKMNRVLYYLEALSYKKELAVMLKLQDGQAIGGWFGTAWDALKAVNWSNEFSEEACGKFLDRFTFIFH